MDPNKRGVVPLTNLAKFYSARQHPHVISGIKHWKQKYIWLSNIVILQCSAVWVLATAAGILPSPGSAPARDFFTNCDCAC